MRLAARGQRDMDDGCVAITDADELARVRRQARSVHTRSLMWAMAVSAVLFFV